jgi:ElaB/YqjD/DUF883 family membrane-anchored ribosome-binding protein
MKSSNDVQDRIADGLASAGEHAKGYVDVGVNALSEVSGKARQVSLRADGYVRENPWLAIGVAAAVGALVGFLVRGRRAPERQ